MKKKLQVYPKFRFNPFFVKLPCRLQWPLILHGYGGLWQPQKYYGLNFNWGSMFQGPSRMLCTIHKQKTACCTRCTHTLMIKSHLQRNTVCPLFNSVCVFFVYWLVGCVPPYQLIFIFFFSQENIFRPPY